MSWTFWKKEAPPPPVDWHVLAARLPSMFVTPKAIGTLSVPTGNLIVGWPWAWNGGLKPDMLVTVDRPSPKGEFPIEISLVKTSEREEKIAAARIVFSQQPVASWEVAAVRGDGVVRARNGTPGFRATLAIFIDDQTLPAFEQYVADARIKDHWEKDVKFETGNRWQHACFAPDNVRPETCAVVLAGNFDDVIVSYWGLDAAGAPVALIADFNVIPPP